MKKLFLLGFLVCTAFACSPDDDEFPTFFYETLPVESVDVPEEFVFGNTYQISMTYLKPSGCHLFNDFYYVTEFNQRTVAIIATVFPDEECEPLEDEVEEVFFNFQVNNTETYVFRFWKGEDESGDDVYHIVEVPVVE